MAIQCLTFDDLLRNPSGRATHVDNPTWMDVEAAIRRLDLVRFNNVGLVSDNGPGLLMTGSAENCMCQRIGVRSDLLVDPTRSLDKMVIIEPGSVDEHPEQYTVNVELALKAAKYFFEHERLDPALDWQVP